MPEVRGLNPDAGNIYQDNFGKDTTGSPKIWLEKHKLIGKQVQISTSKQGPFNTFVLAWLKLMVALLHESFKIKIT